MRHVVSTLAHAKIMLHAAKHPAAAVCGLLLGQRTASDGALHIADAIPLFHSPPLAPMLEIGCHMVSATGAFCLPAGTRG